MKLLELLQLHPEAGGVFAVLGVVVGPPDDVLDQLFFCFFEMLELLFQHFVEFLKKGSLPLQLPPLPQLVFDLPLYLALIGRRLHQ